MIEITNQNDTITRSDVIANIHFLADELKADPASFDQMAEIEELRDLIREGDSATGYRAADEHDWLLISDSHFERYAEEMARDMHGDQSAWPFNRIDWEAAARDMQQDYKQVDYAGETYWVRA